MVKKQKSKLKGLPRIPGWVQSGVRQSARNLYQQTNYGNIQDIEVENANGESQRLTKDCDRLSWWKHLLHIFTGKTLNLFILVLPFAFMSYTLKWGPVAVFCLNFFAMVPLGSLLADFTEELSLHANKTICGLINAAFGSFVELVVAIQALKYNEIRIAQSSLIGSVLSNTVFAVGSCFLFGGMHSQVQKFNSTIIIANMTLLLLVSLAILAPTPFGSYEDISNSKILLISRIASIFLIMMYGLLLFFQLKTHSHLLQEKTQQKPEIPIIVAGFGMGVSFCLIILTSGFLVSSIDGFTEICRVSKSFVGMVLLPIVANLVDNVLAVSLTIKGKVDLGIGVAVGSADQVGLFVIPCVTLIGWIFDINMTLLYPPHETFFFIFAIFLMILFVGNGRSNWLTGIMLLSVYCLLAISFWFEKVQDY